MNNTFGPRAGDDGGMTLVELLIALLVLSVGVLSLARLFPAASRTQVQDRMRVEAAQYMGEKLEQLAAVSWSDTALDLGRHPTGTASELLGNTGSLRRFYQVDTLPTPLTNLKQVKVMVTWQRAKPCTLQTVTYIRKAQ